MSGMLNGGMSGMSGMGGGGIDPMQLMQLFQQYKADPFSKSLPGTDLLGDGKMGIPEPQNPMEQQFKQQEQLAPQQPGRNNVISTDFADTQPGLPNLPDSFQGFGYGQFAPKTHEGDPLRQKLIKQLLDMMQRQQSMQAEPGMGAPEGFMNGMGGF